VNNCSFHKSQQLSRRELGQATNASIGSDRWKPSGAAAERVDWMYLGEGQRKDGKKYASTTDNRESGGQQRKSRRSGDVTKKLKIWAEHGTNTHSLKREKNAASLATNAQIAQSTCERARGRERSSCSATTQSLRTESAKKEASQS